MPLRNQINLSHRPFLTAKGLRKYIAKQLSRGQMVVMNTRQSQLFCGPTPSNNVDITHRPFPNANCLREFIFNKLSHRIGVTMNSHQTKLCHRP